MMHLYRWGYEPLRWPEDVKPGPGSPLEDDFDRLGDEKSRLAGGQGHRWACSERTWWALLDLATIHGWTPTGPMHPAGARPAVDVGEYAPDSGQLVGGDDLSQLIAALEKASRERADPHTLTLPWDRTQEAVRTGGRPASERRAMGVLAEPFQPLENSMLDGFLLFCRGGPFVLG